MSLPASQRRALNQIEETLANDHPGLGPMFAIFTRLTGHEAMPLTEQVTARPWLWPRRWPQRLRPAVVTLIGLAMATGALLTLSLLLPGPQACAGHRQPRRGADAAGSDRAPAHLPDPAGQDQRNKRERALHALNKHPGEGRRSG
jgi:hypothetical protein